MRAGLKALYIRHFFRPGIVGLFVNPFYIARKGLFQSILDLAPRIRGRVLDVGCGYKPYQDLFSCSEYVGLELDTPLNRANNRGDVFYDGGVFPFEDRSFDTIIASEVLEHVFAPGVFLSEIHRVLRDGGGLLLTVPFVWDEHEQPLDYGRYTSYGLKYLLEQNGFDRIILTKTVPDIRVIVQLLNCYLHKQVSTWNNYVKVIIWAIFSAPLNIVGELLSKVLPANPDLFLNIVAFANKRDA